VSLIINEHREYLFDAPRIDAFSRAIAQVVRPGDVVLDLASGTGILGYLACQAGARKVYAVDDGSIVELARALARANGLADRVEVIRSVSTWTPPPEPVDVIVTDQIGHLGFNAGIVEYMSDARNRWLKPGGRMVPNAVTIHGAPWSHDGVREAVECWTRPVAGLDVSLVRPMAASTGYPFQLDPAGGLAPSAPIVRFDLATAIGELSEGTASFAIEREGALDALAGWFVADLAPGVTMTNAPGSPAQIRRRQALLPVDRRTAVRPGDRIEVRMRVRPTNTILEWHVDVGDGAVTRERFRQSTFQGMLISTEDLHRTAPNRVPVLSPAGLARRTVLELCDGRCSIADIEAGVYERHRMLLPTPAAAAAFVAEVLTRYAE
jgi:precorrin-6B methylase 2